MRRGAVAAAVVASVGCGSVEEDDMTFSYVVRCAGKELTFHSARHDVDVEALQKNVTLAADVLSGHLEEFPWVGGMRSREDACGFMGRSVLVIDRRLRYSEDGDVTVSCDGPRGVAAGNPCLWGSVRKRLTDKDILRVSSNVHSLVHEVYHLLDYREWRLDTRFHPGWDSNGFNGRSLHYSKNVVPIVDELKLWEVENARQGPVPPSFWTTGQGCIVTEE